MVAVGRTVLPRLAGLVLFVVLVGACADDGSGDPAGSPPPDEEGGAAEADTADPDTADPDTVVDVTEPAASTELTLYEIADTVAISDVSPLRFSPPPPGPVEGLPGPGDVIILESTLYGDATPRTTDTDAEPPQVIPGLAPFEGEYDTFDPVGDPVGELQGYCVFIRVIDERPEFENRTMECNVTLLLDDGNLVYAGSLDVAALEGAEPTTVPIVGGTDAYAGARGTITLQQPSVPAFDRFRLDITLLD